MKKLVIGFVLVGCTNNEPQYVTCAPMGPSATDKCSIEADGASALADQQGSLHVPVKPDTDWRAAERDRRMELQMEVDPSVVVPIYRLEHYDLSVEWTVTNLDSAPGTFYVDLNGANEEVGYDPSLIDLDPTSDEDPPAPPLSGAVPIEIPANGTIDGTFREDQLLEAAIDLEQMTRGGYNPFRATLTISKNDEAFAPLAGGAEIPRIAWRQLVRVDIVFRPDHHMRLDFQLRVRPHYDDIIHDKGLNAPADEIVVYDPPDYVYTP